MPGGPKVVVTTSERPTATAVPLNTGTAFVVGEASYGPEEAQLVKGLKEAEFFYGPRSETASQELFDWLNAFFALGGSRAYVNRILGSASAAAVLELETAAQAKTLVVTAKYKGLFGNKFKVEVKASGALVILNAESEVLEESPAATKASEVFEYFKGRETYVVVTEGSTYAAGKTEQLKTLASKELGGTTKGKNPTVSEAECKKALEGFPKNLGPGQIGVAEKTNGVKEAVHQAMAEQAQKFNRIALCDLKEAAVAKTTVATLGGEKGTYTAALSQYMIFCSSTAVVQGVTVGTTRTIPASAPIAGLCAQAAATGNNATNPSGKTFPLSPFVLSFTNNFKQTEIEELSEKGINSFNEIQGIPCLYGFVTALSKEKDLIFWQASPARERMKLVSSAEEIGNSYLFKTISKKLLARFQGDLQGLGAKEQAVGALFGETPAEACLVNVGEPINTPATMAAAELNAEMLVRIPPYANVINIPIVVVPISETV